MNWCRWFGHKWKIAPMKLLNWDHTLDICFLCKRCGNKTVVKSEPRNANEMYVFTYPSPRIISVEAEMK